jgi:hypothetical protein
MPAARAAVVKAQDDDAPRHAVLSPCVLGMRSSVMVGVVLNTMAVEMWLDGVYCRGGGAACFIKSSACAQANPESPT